MNWVDSDWVDDADDDGVVSLVQRVRELADEQRALRRAVLNLEGERVRVRCRVHLLPPEHESELTSAMRTLDNRLAVLRHCEGGTEHRFSAMLSEAARERLVLGARYEAAVILVDVAIGSPPRRGDGWAASDVPTSVLDEVNRAWAALRADLVRTTEHLIASDLVRVVGAGDQVADLVVTEGSDEAVAQVRAFVDEVQRAQRVEQQCVDRLRRIALRAAQPDARSWLFAHQVRTRQARQALDMVRAVHAALAEVEALERPELGAR